MSYAFKTVLLVCADCGHEAGSSTTGHCEKCGSRSFTGMNDDKVAHAIEFMDPSSHLWGPEHELHVTALLDDFRVRAYAKYKVGQQEHGGNLWEIASEKLLDHQIEEAIDLVIYLLTEKRRRGGGVQ